MSALIRVRAKCSSMNQSKAEIKQRKDKENDWNSWVKEKRQRTARLHKIKRRLNKSVEKEGYNSKYVETIEKNENITVSVIEGQRNKDGYTRLEDTQSIHDSVDKDLHIVHKDPTEKIKI